jgi:preprotein translocase subunit SecF
MIRFSKYIWLYFLISALLLVPGIYSLVRWGLTPSIDFTGGTLMEVTASKNIQENALLSLSKKSKVTVVSIQKSSSNTYIIRLKPEDDAKLISYENDIVKSSGNDKSIQRKETVGPIIGKELLQKAVVAAILAISAILVYVAYAFKNIKFGVSAVAALFHDLLVVLSVFSLLGHFKGVEVDTLFVTAFLTTMSFSVHDTIVVFDRIRELLRRGERLTFEQLSDKALTETMGRSFSNSLTIVLMLLALVLLGGENIKWFGLALLVGTVSGTYSSPFIATPILILWDRWEKRKK